MRSSQDIGLTGHCRIMAVVWFGIIVCFAGIAAEPGKPGSAKGKKLAENMNSAAKAEPVKGRGRDAEVLPALITLRSKIDQEYKDKQNPAFNLENVARVGEKLVYAVKWKAFPAGRMTLRVKRKVNVRGRLAFAFEMHIESNDFLDMIYAVDTRVTSIADLQTGMSYLLKRRLREGRRKVDDRLEFDYVHKGDDQTLQPVSKYSKIKNGATHHSQPRPIPGPLQDCLSAIYYLRNFKFANPGEKCRFLIGSRKTVDVVTINVLKHEKLRLGRLGTYDCVVVEPKGDKEDARTTLIAARGSARIWLEKNTRIPLMLVVAVPIGNAKVVLIKAENCNLRQFRLGRRNKSRQAPGMPVIAPPAPEDF